MHIVKVVFLGANTTVSNELKAEKAIIPVNFSLRLVEQIAALQLVDLWNFGGGVPFPLVLGKRSLFVDRNHSAVIAVRYMHRREAR